MSKDRKLIYYLHLIEFIQEPLKQPDRGHTINFTDCPYETEDFVSFKIIKSRKSLRPCNFFAHSKRYLLFKLKLLKKTENIYYVDILKPI